MASLKVGMYVNNSSGEIIIPPNGYLGIITKGGHVMELNKSIKVGDIKIPSSRIPTGSVQHSPPSITVFLPENPGNFIVGDTLFINWKSEYDDGRDSIKLSVVNQFDEPIFKLRTLNNYAVIDLTKPGTEGSWDKEDVMIIELKRRLMGSDTRTIKRANKEQSRRIKFDLSRLPQTDDRLYLESALFLLDNAGADSQFCLYKIIKTKKTTTDPMLSSYFNLMFEKYNFKQLKLN